MVAKVVNFLLDFHDGWARWDGHDDDLEVPYGQGPAMMYWILRFRAIVTNVVQGLDFTHDISANGVEDSHKFIPPT